MIILILILALGLRLINLNQSLWLDEATQVILSNGSLQSIIFERSTDFHPPLFYILVHFWAILSQGEVWYRLLPLTAGVLTVYAVYVFCRRFFNKEVALLAAFLLAVAPYHVYYSQEIRMYSFATLLSVLSVGYFYAFLREGQKTNLLFYILSTIALVLTHYMGFFLLAAQLFFTALFYREQLRRVFISTTVIFLLFVPWLPQFFAQLNGGGNIDIYLPGWRSLLTLSFFKAIPLTFVKFSIGRIDFDDKVFYMLLVLIIAVVFGWVLKNSVKVKDKNNLLLWAWLVIPIILTFVVSFKFPMYQPFRLLFILPAYYILLAVGILGSEKYQKIFLVLVVGISMFGLVEYYTDARFKREDWRGAVNLVNQTVDDSSIVVFAWPEPFSPYQWYKGSNKSLGVVSKFPASEEEVNNKMNNLLSLKQILLFGYLQDLSDPGHYIQRWLTSRNFMLSKTYDFNGVGFVYQYIRLQ